MRDGGVGDVLEDGGFSAGALDADLDGLCHCRYVLVRVIDDDDDDDDDSGERHTLGDVAIGGVDDDGDLGGRHGGVGLSDWGEDRRGGRRVGGRSRFCRALFCSILGLSRLGGSGTCCVGEVVFLAFARETHGLVLRIGRTGLG